MLRLLGLCSRESSLTDTLRKMLARKKEIEFLEMKQGNTSVTEYAAKFVELAKFYPHYTAETTEFSKCIKFENGLRDRKAHV